jgi:hypothetical protein
MKRIGNLYGRIHDIKNLKPAHKNARKGKSYYRDVKMVNDDEDYYLKQTQESLVNKTYKTSPYKVSKVWDRTKEREIYKLPYYPDRIVQWAVLQIIEPYLLKTLISNTFSSIKGRGIHSGLDKVKCALKDEENTLYCLKFDVRHYYPSINHEILKQKYRRIFKDNDLLWLIDEIIDSVEMSEGTGIPIGNYLSQWSANVYFSGFDHWLKEVKHCKYVFRYMDDVVILSGSKEDLHGLLKEIGEYFYDLKLELKGNYQIFPVDVRGIDFLGYRIFRNYVLLRKSTCLNFKRKMLKMRKKKALSYSDGCSIQSYLGWLKWCNSYRLKTKYTEGLI